MRASTIVESFPVKWSGISTIIISFSKILDPTYINKCVQIKIRTRCFASFKKRWGLDVCSYRRNWIDYTDSGVDGSKYLEV
jgi:hypothetical protein